LSDASFAYWATIVLVDVGGGSVPRLQLHRTPLAGGSASTLFQDTANYYECLGGMTDIGDALLVLASYAPFPSGSKPSASHLLRVPKDGSPVSEVRPDIVWGSCGLGSSWVAWTGNALVAPVVTGMASIPLAGGAPTPLKGWLFDAEYVQGGGKVYTAFQGGDLSAPAWPPVVDVFDGSTEKFICGREPTTGVIGIAANATGTYVAYTVGTLSSAPQTVIARLP
jgi:hypothetical protein